MDLSIPGNQPVHVDFVTKTTRRPQPDGVMTALPVGLMTTKQAAEYLGLSETTLELWRATNRVRLAYVKLGEAKSKGAAVRYRRQDLDAFINANLCNA